MQPGHDDDDPAGTPLLPRPARESDDQHGVSLFLHECWVHNMLGLLSPVPRIVFFTLVHGTTGDFGFEPLKIWFRD